jgi:hypothetical protein
MAWVSPRTWTTGEIVTAAQLNEQLRDNLNAIGAHARLYKTANQLFTGTTFANDTHLAFPIGANEVWLVDLWLKYIVLAANDLKLRWSMPSGYSTDSFWGGMFETTSGILTSDHHEVSTDLPINVSSASPMIGRFAGVLINGSTAGTAQLQVAELAGSSGVTLYKGNWLIGHRAS